MRLQTAIENCVFEASKLVSTKTLLLKHFYRRQGQPCSDKPVWKGEGGGEGGVVGWGQAKEPASQCASFVETTL